MSSSKGPAWAAIFFGTLALLAIPAAAALSASLASVEVLHAIVIAVPVAFLLGLIGVSLARRARYRLERSVYRPGERTVRFARFLVWAGLYVALIGALALGFYGLLRAASG